MLLLPILDEQNVRSSPLSLPCCLWNQSKSKPYLDVKNKRHRPLNFTSTPTPTIPSFIPHLDSGKNAGDVQAYRSGGSGILSLCSIWSFRLASDRSGTGRAHLETGKCIGRARSRPGHAPDSCHRPKRQGGYHGAFKRGKAARGATKPCMCYLGMNMAYSKGLTGNEFVHKCTFSHR